MRAWRHVPVPVEEIGELVRERAGLVLPDSRRASCDIGIQRAMDRRGETDLAAYLDDLRHDPMALDELVAELTAGEAYFFRDPKQFELIRDRIAAEIAAQRPAGHVFRAWSAACASGEEAYSLAIVLEAAGAGPRTLVLGSDICRPAIARARGARYRGWALRNQWAPGTRDFIHREGTARAVDERFRRRVRFRYLNLATDAYPSFASGTWGMDLILCRNTLLYFGAETARRVGEALLACLAPGGWLLTSTADPVLTIRAPFERIATPVGLAYRHARGERPARLARFAFPVVPTETPATPPDVETVRAAAAIDTARAERTCVDALRRHPLHAELHYLHGTLLAALAREIEAAGALRRALYLDRSLAVAHLALGDLLERLGNPFAARQHFESVVAICARHPDGDEAPLADGAPYARLRQAAAFELALPAQGRGGRP